MSEEILHVGQDLPAAGTRAVQQPTRLYAAKHVRFYGPIFFYFYYLEELLIIAKYCISKIIFIFFLY